MLLTQLTCLLLCIECRVKTRDYVTAFVVPLFSTHTFHLRTMDFTATGTSDFYDTGLKKLIIKNSKENT